MYDDVSPELRVRLRRFWRLHGPGLSALLVLSVFTAVGFEMWRPRQLTYDGLWNARTGVWTTILLFDNAILVAYYALLTRGALMAAREQAAAAEEQLGLARNEREAAREPCVVISRRVLTIPGERHGGGEPAVYEFVNVGSGFALNLTYVVMDRPGSWSDPTAVGGLPSGGAARLAGRLEQPLRDGPGLIGYLVIAEGIGSTRWVATVNVRSKAGDMSHAVVKAEAHKASNPRHLLEGEPWEEITAKYQTIRAELERRGA